MPLYDPALRYFLAVFETGSINAAARRLHVSSSAISRQISRLEKEVGAPFFERMPTGVVATDAAEAFAGFARRAIKDAGQVVDEVHERQRARPFISIAATDGIGHNFIPRVVGQFRAKQRDAQFALNLTEPKVATQMVRDGTVDLGVTFNLAIDSGVKVMYSRPAPLKAVMRQDHPLAEWASVSLRDLHAYPVALPSLPTTNRFLFDLCSASMGLVFDPVFVCDNPAALVNFVQEGDAVTLLGQISLRQESSEAALVAIPLKETELRQRNLQVQCQSGRTLPAVLSAFAELLIAALNQSEI